MFGGWDGSREDGMEVGAENDMWTLRVNLGTDIHMHFY